jgi:hypothetical protein
MNKKIALFLTLFINSFLIGIFGQNPEKLEPVNIIGTRLSVDYSNNTSSTTVNTIANVFDGNFDTYFASYERSNTWVGLDLGEKHVITKVAYSPRRGQTQRLELGVLEGANNPDFGDAVPLCIITERPSENTMTEQEIKNSRGFRYVRYVGPNNVRCNIAELAFYGYPSEGNDSRLTQITNIPDVIIHTTNAQDVTTKTTYIKGIIKIISKDGTNIFTDSVEIRGRGNYSWNFDKKPYRFKLFQSARILDNPARARNWTLINNHGDKTLMRNLLAFDISKRFEMPYSPAGQLVNVFLNGEYKGCYQLCDHIDVREHRVPVVEMKPTDISGNNLTGGYLIEMDSYANTEPNWFHSARNKVPVTIKSPDNDEIVEAQNQYIRDYFNLFEASLFAAGYRDPETGYRRFMDTKTFVRHFLIGEFSGNTDTYWSVYMYKQRNDPRFYFSPVWDFDLAFENDQRTYPINNKTDWVYRNGGSIAQGVRGLLTQLLGDRALVKEIEDTWAEYRDKGIITEENLLQVVDDYAAEIDESQKLNFQRWDILNQKIHGNWQATGSYSAEVETVKEYIRKRIEWMDKKLNYVPASTENPNFDSIKYWTNNDSINLDEIPELTSVEIINITGQIIHKQQVQHTISFSVNQGIYVVRLTNSKGIVKVIKCRV